jgi:hypothetical protein
MLQSVIKGKRNPNNFNEGFYLLNLVIDIKVFKMRMTESIEKLVHKMGYIMGIFYINEAYVALGWRLVIEFIRMDTQRFFYLESSV